jgi:hypothetical protein
MHHFSCSDGHSAVSIKSTAGHVMPNLSFCIQWDLLVTKSIPACPGCQTLKHYFSSSGWPGTVSIKSAQTRYAEVMILHPVESAGHVLHSSVSGA